MAKKKTIPEWAKRKAKAGAEELFDEGRDSVHANRVAAVAKKLYLERRRSVRTVEKRLREIESVVKHLSKIRPSKMSKTRQELLAAYSYAAGVLRELRGQIQG